MTLVKPSASMTDVGIHRKEQCSWHCSLINSTSRVVRYPSHAGMAVRVTKSYSDLQSVVMTAGCIMRNARAGSRQAKSGSIKHPHKSLIQPRRSTLRDIEKASAERVDRTTLAIFFDDHVKGESGACLF